MLSDTRFLLGLLEDGPQTRETIIAACKAHGRPGMVVNSRIAELRKQYPSVTITCTRERRPGRRDAYVYRLAEPQAVAA